MAYSSCTTSAGSSGTCSGCTRKMFFSNPEISDASYATGTSQNNNALTLNTTRHVAVTWTSSKFSGGIIFSVQPNQVASGSNTAITITGWRLAHHDTIMSVTLDGIAATIISQTTNSVEVLSSGLNTDSNGEYKPVVVSSTSGRVTSMNAIMFMGLSRPTVAPTEKPSSFPTMQPTPVPPTTTPTSPPTCFPSTAAPTLSNGVNAIAMFDSGMVIYNISVEACTNNSFTTAFELAIVESVYPQILHVNNITILSCNSSLVPPFVQKGVTNANSEGIVITFSISLSSWD